MQDFLTADDEVIQKQRWYTVCMASKTKVMSAAQIEELKKRLLPAAIKTSQPQNALWSIKTSECTITAYRSGKVLYQGADLSWLDDEDEPTSDKTKAKASSRASQFPQAGSDEVGTGDYFGPVVVAGCIVPDEETAAKLKAMKITDSKAMTDEVIEKVGPQLEEMLVHSYQVLGNEKYNQIYDRQTMNLNQIKAMMHNQAYIHLDHKAHGLPDLRMVDKFCQEKTYYGYLKNVPQVVPVSMETKAESKYIAVAAASVIARYEFLQAWKRMEEQWGMVFEKGGGAKADISAKKFLQIHSMEDLKKVAKLHFANTRKAIKAIRED